MKQEILHFLKSCVHITKHVKTGSIFYRNLRLPDHVVWIWGSSTKTGILLFSSLLFTAFKLVHLELPLILTKPIHHLLPLRHAEKKQVLNII